MTEKTGVPETAVKDVNVNAVHEDAIEFNEIVDRVVKRKTGIDDLTGLFLRKKFETATEIEMGRADRTRGKVSLAILDVDNFKEYNDSYGHGGGDIVLKALARIMKKYTRGADVVGRWGGEEFVVLFPVTSDEDAEKASEKLQLAIEEELNPKKDKKIERQITVSIGVAEWNGKEEGLEEWIDRADKALYQAKEGGRNKVVVAKTGAGN